MFTTIRKSLSPGGESKLTDNRLVTDIASNRIRATYTTNAQPLNPAFLVPADTDRPPPVSSKQSSNRPPIINILSTDFIPSLNDHHFQRIDALLARDPSWGMPPASVRDNVTEKAEGKALKLDKKTSAFQAGKTLVTRECANCHQVEKVGKTMMTCSRCKTVCSSIHFHS